MGMNVLCFILCLLLATLQYYESFTEGSYLYISMELVEGVSLLDHLHSLAGKGRRMHEADVWQVCDD
jgi:NIMA (never in mitosis gene a)-related kinase